jgi:deoxyribodipyrimidine photo-lyase
MAVSPAIVWFRRDLRVSDHAPLRAALKAHDGNIIPLYIVSTWQHAHRWTGEPRQRFLCGCLASLANNLESLGGRLIVRAGVANQVLDHLIEETGATALYFHRDPDPYGRAQEEKVATVAKRRGVEIHGSWGISLHPPEAVLTGEGKSYRVYSPFGRAWNKLPISKPLARPAKISTPSKLHSKPIPDVSHWGLVSDPRVEVIEPGERAARQRMKKFLGPVAEKYADDRNTPAGRTSSRLSQDLRFGTLSARELVTRAREYSHGLSAAARGSVDKFIAEVAWRDFHLQLLWHFPEVLEQEFNPDFRGVAWKRDDASFARWCAWKTGYPFVDAGMRELNATGFMHNRVRMVVSMFLTKDLHLDWRMGESYFMQRLVDGEIASNNGGWQWSAGCGADAAPYFRIQNPWLQGGRYDAGGDYIKQWVSELKDVAAAKLHAPPASGSRLAKNYPPPMVDHAVERDETMRIFNEQLGKTRKL